jgi:anti-sigma factor RsiW
MATTPHPDALLISYLRGELAESDRRSVADHLTACSECARAAEDFQRILGDLESSLPLPPRVHWGAYRAELREKLEARRQRWGWQWLRRPVPLGLSAAAAGVLLILGVQSWISGPQLNGDMASLEETVVASRLDLLRQYAVIERLDLWEDLDVVRRLDEVYPSRKG